MSLSIKRYLSECNLKRFLSDFKFLFNIIQKSRGELDLRLRDNYFNLYYKGCSLAKVLFKKECYEISMSKKFTDGVFDKDKRIKDASNRSSKNSKYLLRKEELHPFFQKKHMNKLCGNIKKANYGEEIVFEQMLITDNLNNDKVVVIDRQITETKLNRKRLDLLALRQVSGNKYKFLILEVKLGNNPELSEDVGNQLKGYIKHISSKNTAKGWKYCYEENYRQMKKTGLLSNPKYDEINIIDGVEGVVVVGGYSGIAEQSISTLRKKYPEIKIKQFKNML